MSDLDVGGYPAKPSETQPSAWHAHPSIRKVAFSLWGLVVACAVWAALATLIWYLPCSKVESSVQWKLWTFFPLVSSRALWLEFSLSGGVTVHWWIVSFFAMALVRGPLTLGLHCSALIVNYSSSLNLHYTGCRAFIPFIYHSSRFRGATNRRDGPQPAAYGHLQTLANLVDEWSPVMWWGHKEDGVPYCHAGICLFGYEDDVLTLLHRDE
ncbi:hypothetical protein M405DRAFT_923313, partial [Rhizopogon salebrosus TDB-379]